ncbi:MAG: NAD(P)/FAD-dependent oxidoreductase [Lentisphaerae bacterium]|nr:NAD(P)/FAD-dependent oxidoreductase [Lentisphaerota bacterium]
MRILIAGGGIAAVEAAVKARELDKDCQITIFTDEDILPYRRPLLVEMLTENIPMRRFLLHDQAFYDKHQIQIVSGKKVQGVNAAEQLLIFDDNTQENYDRLILAMGCSVKTLPVNTADGVTLYTLHNYKDLLKLNQALQNAQSVLVIGGGVLGLECASQLQKKQMQVTVIERNEEILSSNLDVECGKFLRQQLRQVEQLTLLTNTQLRQITPVGQTLACQFSGSVVKQLYFDLALSAAGITPNEPIWLPQNQRDALHCNEFMRLPGVENIFTAGDCADYSVVPRGNYLTARQMGAVAGCNAVDLGSKAFKNPIPELRCTLWNIPIYCAGITNADQCECAVEETASTLQKLYYRENKLIGCTLIGNVENAVRFHRVIARHWHGVVSSQAD